MTRIRASEGIQEGIYVPIGGIEQYIQIRGEDSGNPVILWLHGGPGFPLTYLTYRYQTPLEGDYTIACWEQRGSGRTYYRNHRDGDATIEQLLSDMDEVIDYLRGRFGQEGIILIGQSWGTVLAMEYINMHPEKVSAYIGVGQVTNFRQGKIFAAENAVSIALSGGHAEDAALLRHGIEQLSAAQSMEQLDVQALESMIVTSQKYLLSSGGMSGMAQMMAAIASPDMTWNDAKWFLFASNTTRIIASQKHLVAYMYFRFDIENMPVPATVPICFIQGENDWITPTALVQDYYARIAAENTAMIMIPDAGHTPFLDDPERFCEAVRGFLAGGGG
ncbi:MAG: alpha/beta hydrolase [Oscillospiraceae bacterium]|nr:alpha/beta hydrolase [Oscillospiraceae bacterium]